MSNDAFAARPPQHANSIEHIGRRLVPPTLDTLEKNRHIAFYVKFFKRRPFSTQEIFPKRKSTIGKLR